jgi:zinc transporter 1/2/3
MFEGLALGTRIAALGKPTSSPSSPTPAPPSDETKVNPTADGESNNSTPSAIPPLATPVSVSTTHKILLATAFALVTPIGMAIGIGVLHRFNGNDPSTVIAIGTLDALSAGILVWVGVVEMWAHDWMLAGGELTRSGPVRTGLGLAALVVGMAVMSLLGKWA